MNGTRVPLAIALLLALAPPGASASDCSRTSVGLTPIDDLGAGLYQGYSGGLYPGGSNVRPATHDAAGLAIANSIGPLDTLGQPDPAGRVVLISIGMSNTTQEFSAFVPVAMNDPMRNPRLAVIDCARGGQAANLIRSPTAAYWDTVDTRLRGHGSSPLQAQVVWLKEADAGPTGGFPASTNTLLNDLGAIVRIIRQRLPSVRLVYLSSRIYAGYATTTLNPEPYAYESAFAVKWLIEAQINGVDSLNYDPGAGAIEAPWMAWGPYLWADGLVPRSDGLSWKCSDFAADGTHPATSARTMVADRLHAFFSNDATTTPWYLKDLVLAAPASPSGALDLALAPNPSAGELSAVLRAPAGSAWRLEIYDAAGRRLRELARGIGDGRRQVVRWDEATAGLPGGPGLFWLRLTGGGASVARRIVRIEGPR
jgi:hypothetical protein